MCLGTVIVIERTSVTLRYRHVSVDFLPGCKLLHLDFSRPLLYTLSLKTRTTRQILQSRRLATTKEEDRTWNPSGGSLEAWLLHQRPGNDHPSSPPEESAEECLKGRSLLKL